jgi:hypothetical protein
VQTGSRATAEDLKPGQLSPPVLNILNPTALPDPTSISAVLNALAALNFRDMSGLAGTQGLVSTGETGTLDAATAAGKLASENMKTEAQKAVSMGQIAADIAKAAIAADVAKTQAKATGGGGGVDGISRAGAAINQGRKMDQESGAAGASGGTGGADGIGGSGGGDASGGGSDEDGAGGPGGGSDRMVLASGGGGHEADAFNNSLFGPIGTSGIDAAKIALASAVKAAPGGGGAGGAGGGAVTTVRHPAIGQIFEHIDASGLASHAWADIGTVPIGYYKGMALTYARVYCHYSIRPGEPPGWRDRFAVRMAQGVTPGADVTTDAVARFATQFSPLGADLSVEGVDVLRAVFTILFGLGVRESSGQHCTGWPRKKTVPPTATNSEAGLFQISYDIGVGKPGDFKDLYERYKQRPTSGFLDYFREGVICSAADRENFGKGVGADFQQFCKVCPAFTVELTALGIRTRANHWGPINRREVEILPEVWTLLRGVEAAIDDLDGCIAVL